MSNGGFITIYVSDNFQLSAEDFFKLEKKVGCEIGEGTGFFNLYTKKKSCVNAFIEWVGEEYIIEIASSDDDAT